MIVGSFVVKNEANRYLDISLKAASEVFDEVFVYDDRSTDNTVEVAKKYTDNVFVNDDLSFMEHEGVFRQTAWRKCIKCFNLTENDWIFVNDADEVLSVEGRENSRASRSELVDTIKAELTIMVSDDNISGYRIHIPDVQYLDLDSFKFKVRTDGFWNLNYAPRMARADVLAPFMDKKMGSFSVPERFITSSMDYYTPLKLLHLGYADKEDLKERYDRYSSLKNHGHDRNHIKSIITNPTLKMWVGGSLYEF